MKKLIAVSVMAMLGLVPSSALGHPLVRSDPAGDAEGPLDIIEVTAKHPHQHRANHVEFTIETTEPFTNADLSNIEGYWPASVGISTDADRAFERLIYVSVEPDSQTHLATSPRLSSRRDGWSLTRTGASSRSERSSSGTERLTVRATRH